jgi:N-methylhydantoinase B
LQDIIMAHATGVGRDEFPGDKEIIASNVSLLPLHTGTVEYHNWQGAGGYGDPVRRELESVAHDVRSGAVSVAAARDIYGVAVEGGNADRAGSERLREEIKQQRLTRATASGDGQVGSSPGVPIELPASFFNRSAPLVGSIDYAETLVFDFDANEVRCRSCEHVLGDATDDFRAGALHETRSASAAGHARGEDYLDPDNGVYLDVYYCYCGIQLEVDVRVDGFPRPGFRLAATAGGQT